MGVFVYVKDDFLMMICDCDNKMNIFYFSFIYKFEKKKIEKHRKRTEKCSLLQKIIFFRIFFISNLIYHLHCFIKEPQIVQHCKVIRLKNLLLHSTVMTHEFQILFKYLEQ